MRLNGFLRGTLPGALSRVTAFVLVLLTTLAALALWLLDPIPVQSLRLAQFDQFQRWHPSPSISTQVRVVDIDEASLKAYGQWPWPRLRIVELVQRLHASGARVIAFDVLLAEPDRTSPKRMAQLWQNPQASAALQGLPDHDEVLAQHLVDRGVVLGASLLRLGASASSSLSSSEPPAPPYRLISSGVSDPLRGLHGFDAAVWPLPMFSAQAAGVGALNFVADSDGVLRRVPLLLKIGKQMVPTLSAEALRVDQNARNYLLRSTAAGVQDLRIGTLTVPTNAQAEIWLHYPQDQPGLYISAAQVLTGQVPAGQLDGRIVLVGSSAAGLMDLRFNPLGQQMPGVQAHALALAQMQSGHYLQRPAWASGAEALALVLGVLLVSLVALAAPIRWSALSTALVLTLLLGGAWWAFVAGHLLLDAVNPALAVMLGFGLSSGFHHLASEREKRWVRDAFSRYVSPNRVAHLMAHPDQLQLNGQRQVCSFVFTDLVGFTSMIEGCDPAQVVVRINDYLEAMLEIVFKHEGTLDRIMGDALVVMFSAPVPQPDHCQRALDCALAMDAFASGYAERLQQQGMVWGATRIGVHAGEVIVGNFGGKALFDYRALGDPINTAARLESVNKHLGTRVCISQAILDSCTGVPTRAVGRLLLKGKIQPLQAYEPLAATDVSACAMPADYAAAMRLLQPGESHQPKLALDAFMVLARCHPHDPLVALHLQRLHQGATDDLIVLSDK